MVRRKRHILRCTYIATLVFYRFLINICYILFVMRAIVPEGACVNYSLALTVNLKLSLIRAWTGPWGSRGLRLPEFLYIRHMEVLTLSDPTSNLVRQYDFPVPLRCRKTSDTVLLRLFARCRNLSDGFPHVVRNLANRWRRLYSSCFSMFSLLKL
jgi:hypothetical protein